MFRKYFGADQNAGVELIKTFRHVPEMIEIRIT